MNGGRARLICACRSRSGIDTLSELKMSIDREKSPVLTDNRSWAFIVEIEQWRQRHSILWQRSLSRVYEFFFSARFRSMLRSACNAASSMKWQATANRGR
jgi:hypothetical protein